MGPQETELAADLGAEASRVVVRWFGGMEEGSQIAVTEAGGGKLTAADGFEQGQVGGVADTQGTQAPPAVAHARGDLIEEVPRRVESSTVARAST